MRAVLALGITIPDDMIALLSDEAKYWLKTLPHIGDKTEADIEPEILLNQFNKYVPKVLTLYTIKQSRLRQTPSMVPRIQIPKLK